MAAALPAALAGPRRGSAASSAAGPALAVGGTARRGGAGRRGGEPSRGFPAGQSRAGRRLSRAQAFASRWLRGAERAPGVRGGVETQRHPPPPRLPPPDQAPRPALPLPRDQPGRAWAAPLPPPSPPPSPPPPSTPPQAGGTRAGAVGGGRTGPVNEQRPEGQVTV